MQQYVVLPERYLEEHTFTVSGPGRHSLEIHAIGMGWGLLMARNVLALALEHGSEVPVMVGATLDGVALKQSDPGDLTLMCRRQWLSPSRALVSAQDPRFGGFLHVEAVLEVDPTLPEREMTANRRALYAALVPEGARLTFMQIVALGYGPVRDEIEAALEDS
jgi:hypothetical protein